MRKCLLLCAALLLATAPRMWAASTSFVLGDQGGVVVAVTLDGEGPFKMLLDTGATHSVLTADIVGQIGAKAVAQASVFSPAGSMERPIVEVDTLSIGPITVDMIFPSVAAAGAYGAKGEIKGLIGQDVLAGLRYTLDFRRRQIEWHDATPPYDGMWLPLSFEHGRFLVAFPQAVGTLRLVPDSGSGGLVLFEAHCRETVQTVETGETVELATAAGRRLARSVLLPVLRIGDRTLRDVPAVSISGHDVAHPGAGDGLLPLHIFDRVTFDGPARLLLLDGKG